MKPIYTALISALAFLVPGMGLAQDLGGVWRTEPTEHGGGLQVAFAPCEEGSDVVCGHVVGVFGASGEELLGKRVVWGMRPSGPGFWQDGNLWDVESGKVFVAKMLLRAGTLNIKGCVSFVCRNHSWQLVDVVNE